MNAADVLAQAMYDAKGYLNDGRDLRDALLAHGEQGIAILPDGTLWALSKVPSAYHYEHFTLSPVSAEAGDTGD